MGEHLVTTLFKRYHEKGRPREAFEHCATLLDVFNTNKKRYKNLYKKIAPLSSEFEQEWKALKKHAYAKLSELIDNGFFSQEKAERIRGLFAGEENADFSEEHKKYVLDVLQAELFDSYDRLIKVTHQLYANYHDAEDQELAQKVKDIRKIVVEYADQFSIGQSKLKRVLRTIGQVTLYNHCFQAGKNKNVGEWLNTLKQTWWPEPLAKQHLYIKDLSGLNVEEAKFEGVKFGTPEGGVDLNGAHCQGARFTGAYLKNSTVVGANFTGAVFDNANLEGIRFNKVNCTRASFRNANMENTSLENSTFSDASLGGVDSSKVAIDSKTKKTLDKATQRTFTHRGRVATLRRGSRALPANAGIQPIEAETSWEEGQDQPQPQQEQGQHVQRAHKGRGKALWNELC